MLPGMWLTAEYTRYVGGGGHVCWVPADATTVAYAGCEGAKQNQVWSGGSGI